MKKSYKIEKEPDGKRYVHAEDMKVLIKKIKGKTEKQIIAMILKKLKKKKKPKKPKAEKVPKLPRGKVYRGINKLNSQFPVFRQVNPLSSAQVKRIQSAEVSEVARHEELLLQNKIKDLEQKEKKALARQLDDERRVREAENQIRFDDRRIRALERQKTGLEANNARSEAKRAQLRADKNRLKAERLELREAKERLEADNARLAAIKAQLEAEEKKLREAVKFHTEQWKDIDKQRDKLAEEASASSREGSLSSLPGIKKPKKKKKLKEQKFEKEGKSSDLPTAAVKGDSKRTGTKKRSKKGVVHQHTHKHEHTHKQGSEKKETVTQILARRKRELEEKKQKEAEAAAKLEIEIRLKEQERLAKERADKLKADEKKLRDQKELEEKLAAERKKVAAKIAKPRSRSPSRSPSVSPQTSLKKPKAPSRLPPARPKALPSPSLPFKTARERARDKLEAERIERERLADERKAERLASERETEKLKREAEKHRRAAEAARGPSADEIAEATRAALAKERKLSELQNQAFMKASRAHDGRVNAASFRRESWGPDERRREQEMTDREEREEFARLKHQHGLGIVSTVKEVAGKVVKRVSDIFQGMRQRASPSIRQWLEKNGEKKIKKIVVGRKPIQSGVEKVANLLSLGKYEANKKSLGYDKMFHLFMIITLDDGSSIKLEKEEVPKLTISSDAGPDKIEVQKQPNVSMNEFIKNAETKAGGTKLWVYDPISQNCQYFVKWCLQGSNLLTPEVEKFVMQDANKVIEGFSWFQKLGRAATNIANVADVALHGQGFKKGGLYADEIDHKMKHYPNYLGTIAADEIHRLKPKPNSRFSFIINSDPHQKEGVHWMAVYADLRPHGSESVEFYNSFADHMNRQMYADLKELIRKSNPDNLRIKFKENEVVSQRANSDSCGYLAIDFLEKRYNDMSFQEATNFHNVLEAEREILPMKIHREKFGYI